MRLLVIAAALAVSACASAQPAVAPTCAAERGVYTLRGQPGAMLRIVRTPHALNAYSELAARVDYEGDTYWFAFVSSLGYSRDYVGRTQDPFEAARREDAGKDIGEEHAEPEYNGSELHAFDANYNVMDGVPQAGEPAPAHLLATGIASSIWYSTPRRELPKAMWDLTSCDDYVHG
jgi:hypothetical protein